MRQLTLLLAVVIFSLPTVFALGISPASYSFEYDKGVYQNLTLTLLNSGGEPMRVMIYTDGALAKYIQISAVVVDFSIGETRKDVHYSIRLPSGITTPGLHTAEIVAFQVPIGADISEASQVSATTALVQQVKVYVPFPGKYIQGSIQVTNRNVNEDVLFTIGLHNRGGQDIEDIAGFVEVFSWDGSPVGKSVTDTTFLSAGQSGKITARWRANVEQGPYKARATILYDGQQKNFETEFLMGQVLVDVNSFELPGFKLGNIAKIELGLSGKWSQKIERVFADITVIDESGNTIVMTRTNEISLSPDNTAIITAYWDTNGTLPGNYSASIVLHFGDKSIEKKYSLYVGKDFASATSPGIISSEAIGMGDAVADKKKFKITTTHLLLLLVVLLLLGNGLLLLYYIRMKKRRKR